MKLSLSDRFRGEFRAGNWIFNLENATLGTDLNVVVFDIGFIRKGL